MADLYTGDINEFVDWNTGNNTFTNQNVTDGKAVSGYSIRKLLLEKLKSPIYVEEDKANNLYRIFSSLNAYRLWAENPSDNADLLLFTIPRPSDYKLILNLTNNGDRYIKLGEDTNALSKIQFDWRIYNDEGDSSDGLSVTYTILNVDLGSSSTFIRRYNKGVSEDFSIYQYLKVGENRVTIEAQGNNTGARNSTSFNINVLNITVSCNFDFAGKHTKNETLRVPYTFYRNNINGTAKIYFVIDNDAYVSTVDIPKGGNNTFRDTGKMISPSLESGLHSLQVYAQSIYNDGLTTIYSNLLYFTFTVASSEMGTVGKFINIATSFDSGNFPLSLLTLNTILYYPSELRWGYYTDATDTDTSISATWKLINGESTTLATINANTGYEASPLNYISTIYTLDEQLYLGAYFEEDELIKIPIYIIQNLDLINILETDNYLLKMTAYGKTNNSSNRDTWKDITDTISTEFHNILWTPNSGWYNNSFRTAGVNQYAIINFSPFHSTSPNFPFDYGKTIEIEFESEKVNSQDDKLIVIGNPTTTRIEITPNTATLYDNLGNSIIHTNYKANERIKLAFIINKTTTPSTVDDGLVFIVNNGILERGTLASSYRFNSEGTIKIGGTQSGIRVYNLRVYDKSISYFDEYNNFVYDADNKTSIVSRNQILNLNGVISYDLCKNKIDTILITGDLSNILNKDSDKDTSVTDVMIERICPYDASKDFIIGEIIDDPDNINHQKVINGAMIRKHGLSTLNYPISSMKIWFNKSKSGAIPIFYKNALNNMLFNKNRYKMKNTSIPANKFVLLANYADSSGVHNGGLLRLIQSSWYNARVDGKYVLRTEPQLFSSIKSSEKENYGLTSVWLDYFPNVAFPYQIEIGADSFPCAVFYYDLNGTKTATFLGLYVFMEDKKSDFNYGERSIYKVATDPFCMTVTHKDDDVSANRIWNNNLVLRMEVLEVNHRYSSYTTTDNLETRVGNSYAWEAAFELIYPDPDDIIAEDEKNGLDKFSPNSKFVATVKPFLDWYKWLVSTKDNQLKFLNEAEQHLDLYKLAAYYIFVLRFSLVDSLERNAQIKTYDGLHFHYEPWDMDIALGNKNDGGIAFNPPVDRNTKLNAQTYAISGRACNDQGEIISSNWLWDALEAWPYWINTIVPKVADALYIAGLTYDNITEMFDENYANKWCEIIYNESGHFKYVESSGGDYTRWLPWLLGARMSHRHWWLSSSMDYYDAKWFCGDYKNHKIYLAASVNADSNKVIRVIPNSLTYMIVTVNNSEDTLNPEETIESNNEVSPSNPLIYHMTNGASTKAPIHIYGANYMETIDLGDIAVGIDGLNLTGTYSLVLGAPLKHLDLGTRITEVDTDTYTTTLSPATFGITANHEDINAFENLETLNIRGHLHFGNVNLFSFGINQWMRDLNLTLLKDFYAMGANLVNFYSSDSGNDFNIIELPSTINILNLKNSSWNELSFWDKQIPDPENDPLQATLTKYSKVVNGLTVAVPPNITEVKLLGSTGKTRESLLFVKDWIKSIIDTYGETALHNYTLEMDDVFWNASTVGEENLLTFEELRLLALTNHNLRGYLLLKHTGSTGLTATLLSLIREWFGDTVFTKGSAGLVVDYAFDYVLINVGGQVTVDGGNVYLMEGNRAIVSATKFTLSEGTEQNFIWGVRAPGSSQGAIGVYKSTLLHLVGKTMYLVANESNESNYLVEVVCASTTGLGQVGSVIINVITMSYPTSITIASAKTTDSIDNVRGTPEVYSFWHSGIISEFYLDILGEYTATIEEVNITLTNSNGEVLLNKPYTYFKTLNSEMISLDDYLKYRRMSRREYGLILGNGTIPLDDEISSYTLLFRIKYKSTRVTTLACVINVIDDSTQIVTSLSGTLYNIINHHYTALYGSAPEGNVFYKSDLARITGPLSVTYSRLDLSNLRSLVCANGQCVLKYLPNVTKLNFTACVNLESVSDAPLVFDKMTHLEEVIFRNCKSLNEDLDLRNNSAIKTVDALTYGDVNYNVGALLPDGTIATTVQLYIPKTIYFVNPTSLTPQGVTISNSSKLESIDIVNIPNGLSFDMLAKVMNW